jgi:hypothetical protein
MNMSYLRINHFVAPTAALFLLSCTSCIAADESEMKDEAAKLAQSANTNAQANKSQTAKTNTSSASLAKKTLGFIAGSIGGIPVSMVRNPVYEEKWSVDNWTGDNKDKPRVTVPASIFFAPFAVADGILLSPFSAVKRSWQNKDNPFSKEQFSLGEIKHER